MLDDFLITPAWYICRITPGGVDTNRTKVKAEEMHELKVYINTFLWSVCGRGVSTSW